MRGIVIFVGIAIVNAGLLFFTTIYGLVFVDLSLIVTLLILLLDGQSGIVRRLGRKKSAHEQQALLRQREAAEQDFEKKDLPTEKDIADISREADNDS